MQYWSCQIQVLPSNCTQLRFAHSCSANLTSNVCISMTLSQFYVSLRRLILRMQFTSFSWFFCQYKQTCQKKLIFFKLCSLSFGSNGYNFCVCRNSNQELSVLFNLVLNFCNWSISTLLAVHAWHQLHIISMARHNQIYWNQKEQMIK